MSVEPVHAPVAGHELDAGEEPVLADARQAAASPESGAAAGLLSSAVVTAAAELVGA
jgi:hypothetical protein